MSVAAYRRTIRTTESPREVERKVFINVTGALERHAEDGPLSAGLRQALESNQKLWLTLRGDLLSPENSLPTELKKGLVQLSYFVDGHTIKVIKGEASVKPLIDINRSIISGLSRSAPAPAQVMQNAGQGEL